jgi:hypothetical protein
MDEGYSESSCSCRGITGHNNTSEKKNRQQLHFGATCVDEFENIVFMETPPPTPPWRCRPWRGIQAPPVELVLHGELRAELPPASRAPPRSAPATPVPRRRTPPDTMSRAQRTRPRWSPGLRPSVANQARAHGGHRLLAPAQGTGAWAGKLGHRIDIGGGISGVRDGWSGRCWERRSGWKWGWQHLAAFFTRESY